jgi:hypothetical protein
MKRRTLWSMLLRSRADDSVMSGYHDEKPTLFHLVSKDSRSISVLCPLLWSSAHTHTHTQTHTHTHTHQHTHKHKHTHANLRALYYYVYMHMHVYNHIEMYHFRWYIRVRHSSIACSSQGTAILIIIEGQLSVFQRFSSSKLPVVIVNWY